jgi:hypothetical protein
MAYLNMHKEAKRAAFPLKHRAEMTERSTRERLYHLKGASDREKEPAVS